MVSHSIGVGRVVDGIEAVLDGGDYKVLYVLPLDAFDGGEMGDGFTITALKSKGNAEFRCVVVANFRTIRHEPRFG